MPIVAISGLPDAASLAGTEFLPVVQSGTTKKLNTDTLKTIIGGWLATTYGLTPLPTNPVITFADVHELFHFDSSAVGVRGTVPTLSGTSGSLSATRFQFGGHSLRKDAGTPIDTWSSWPDSTARSNWTFEYRLYADVNDSAGEGHVFRNLAGSNLTVTTSWDVTQKMRFFRADTSDVLYEHAITGGVWYAVAIVLDTVDLIIFIDGTEVYRIARSLANITTSFAVDNLSIGRGGYDYHYGTYHYIDEFRILKIAGYVTDYTVSTSAFPDS